MANGVFNVAKGIAVHYASLPAANDALVVLLLSAAEADSALVDYDDLAALLSGSNTEATFTNYARKTVSSVTTTVDDSNNWTDVDIADQTWSSAGGSVDNSIVKLLVCYDPDTTGGTDADIIPLTHHDFSVTTDGSDLVAQIAASGFYRAS